MKRTSRSALKGSLFAAALLAAAGLTTPRPASAAEHHYKVFLDLSYSGNVWQTAAANGIKAEAHTPPYDKMITFKEVISGTDVQHQISDLQSMIAAGANAIIFYPVSPTGLNRVVEEACKRGILMFTYESSVTAPCAYNINALTEHYGANAAQWMVNEMHGRGELVINHGVAGTALTRLMTSEIMPVFERYPDIKIVSKFFGNWNDAVSEEAVTKVLAAHPNIDAIWSVDGTYGSLQAVLRHRPDRLVVIAGQANNGYRLLIGNKEMQAKGLKGLSAWAGPAEGSYTFKLMMEELTGQAKLAGHQIAYPLDWVSYKNIKMCTGDSFVNGCNVFPADKVPPLFIDTSLSEELVPELDLKAVQTGEAKPGAHIEKLPPVKYGTDLPGINCQHCKAPAGWQDTTFIKPIPVPPKAH
ncbi:MAG: sugar ABC transporter substrate-binding protein [Acetobacteraceae bacterium]